MRLYGVLERAIVRAAEDKKALLEARARWNALAGEVHDAEPLFEERAAAFLEWFLLDQRGDGRTPVPPIARLIREARAEDQPHLVALGAAHRGLFVVREPAPDGVLLEDLWGGALFRVFERRRLVGLGPGEVFEARLVADVEAPPRLVFTKSFCFHPREALAPIRAQAERARRAREEREVFLFRLLRRRLRCERYRHVSPLRIYEAGEARDF